MPQCGHGQQPLPPHPSSPGGRHEGRLKPKFAGFNHKMQLFAASVPKLAAMLGAFQLRKDLRVALKKKGSKTLAALYKDVRDDWAATQIDPKGKATPFTRRITLRGKLVLLDGSPIDLDDPRSPQLETI